MACWPVAAQAPRGSFPSEKGPRGVLGTTGRCSCVTFQTSRESARACRCVKKSRSGAGLEWPQAGRGAGWHCPLGRPPGTLAARAPSVGAGPCLILGPKQVCRTHPQVETLARLSSQQRRRAHSCVTGPTGPLGGSVLTGPLGRTLGPCSARDTGLLQLQAFPSITQLPRKEAEIQRHGSRGAGAGGWHAAPRPALSLPWGCRQPPGAPPEHSAVTAASGWGPRCAACLEEHFMGKKIEREVKCVGGGLLGSPAPWSGRGGGLAGARVHGPGPGPALPEAGVGAGTDSWTSFLSCPL